MSLITQLHFATLGLVCVCCTVMKVYVTLSDMAQFVVMRCSCCRRAADAAEALMFQHQHNYES